MVDAFVPELGLIKSVRVAARPAKENPVTDGLSTSALSPADCGPLLVG
jgi:hypothetical protein